MEALVSPLPIEETTPPVMNTNLVRLFTAECLTEPLPITFSRGAHLFRGQSHVPAKKLALPRVGFST